MDIIDIQKALKKQGFDPGPRDGAWGAANHRGAKGFPRSAWPQGQWDHRARNRCPASCKWFEISWDYGGGARDVAPCLV